MNTKGAPHIIKKLMLIVAMIIQTGCMSGPSFDPIKLSVFIPEGNNDQRIFIVTSEPTDRRTSRAIEAENIRIAWMNRWVKKNRLCPQGYTAEFPEVVE